MTPSERQVATGRISDTKRAAMQARTDALVAANAARATTDAEKRLAAFLRS